MSQSNNPIGSLGLRGGILDAFVYGNALVRVVISQGPRACSPTGEGD